MAELDAAMATATKLRQGVKAKNIETMRAVAVLDAAMATSIELRAALRNQCAVVKVMK